MKITPIDIIKDMSGKVCSHSDITLQAIFTADSADDDDENAGCMLGMDYHYKAKFTAHSDRNCNEPTQ